MKTAIYSNDLSLKHDTGNGHPETVERYRAVSAALKANPLENWVFAESRPATKGMIKAAHTGEHFKDVEMAYANGKLALDADTTISMHSFDAALAAAGGVCGAVTEVVEGGCDNAFVIARPPGHHATAEHSMGFCIFNNVAVGARYALDRFKDVDRVAIIDWDVHHGNGTQGIFYGDRDVYFFSAHQYPWYPGTGSRGETGYGRGLGSTKNLPVKANTPREVYKRMFAAAIEEISKDFHPDLIFISAGFDGHRDDPLGQLLIEDEDFRQMTAIVKEWAKRDCGGRVVSVLEGGYNLETLGSTARAHVEALSSDSD
ncbi:MAG: histone deacetylase [Pyrinomonadaceae bacterium]